MHGGNLFSDQPDPIMLAIALAFRTNPYTDTIGRSKELSALAEAADTSRLRRKNPSVVLDHGNALHVNSKSRAGTV